MSELELDLNDSGNELGYPARSTMKLLLAVEAYLVESKDRRIVTQTALANVTGVAPATISKLLSKYNQFFERQDLGGTNSIRLLQELPEQWLVSVLTAYGMSTERIEGIRLGGKIDRQDGRLLAILNGRDEEVMPPARAMSLTQSKIASVELQMQLNRIEEKLDKLLNAPVESPKDTGVGNLPANSPKAATKQNQVSYPWLTYELRSVWWELIKDGSKAMGYATTDEFFAINDSHPDTTFTIEELTNSNAPRTQTLTYLFRLLGKLDKDRAFRMAVVKKIQEAHEKF